jgi:Protein of unknown function (DUF402)
VAVEAATGAGAASWAYGDVVVRREISWGRPSSAIAVRVVEDSPTLLATYIPERAPMAYDESIAWPTESGRHPWWPKVRWEGHGVLMLQRPGDEYAVWHFWSGPERRFTCWYFNVQEPFRRTSIGYDTQDLELDVVLLDDFAWFLKDEEQLAEHVRTGRHSRAVVRRVREVGAEIVAMIEARDFWWDLELAQWQPDPRWSAPDSLSTGWHEPPWTTPTMGRSDAP